MVFNRFTSKESSVTRSQVYVKPPSKGDGSRSWREGLEKNNKRMIRILDEVKNTLIEYEMTNQTEVPKTTVF